MHESRLLSTGLRSERVSRALKPFLALIVILFLVANIVTFIYGIAVSSSYIGWLSILFILASTYALSKR